MADDRTPEQLAYDRGAEMADLRAESKGHKQRLDVVNNTIGRAATESAKLRACVEELLAESKIRAAIERDRVKVEAKRVLVEEARAKAQVTKWNLALTGMGLLGGFAGLLATAGVLPG